MKTQITTKGVCAAGMFAVLMGAGVIFLSNAPLAWAADPASSPAPEKLSPAEVKAVADPSYPAEVSLIKGSGGWLFQASADNQRLYVNDKDAPGKSNCDSGCSSAWPPLIAPRHATTLGDWTVITRDDRRKQWAYKGRPVYFRIHDSVTNPTGNGVDGTWHFLEP